METVTQDAQTELPELIGAQVIEDPELERQLEERWQKKEALGSYQKAFGEIDAAVRGRLAQMKLQPGRVRCGSFVIVVKDTPPRSVAFETEAKRVIRIVPAEGD